MASFKVNVKWGKQKYSDLDVCTSESPDVFKSQLFSLTNVLPERQKIMLKGATVKDNWDNIKLKNGLTFLMMGTAEELPQEPQEKVVFLEDMTEDQLMSAMDLLTGLDNLGNTCYMNATVQMLRSVPELNLALQGYSGNAGSAGLMASLGGGGGSGLDDGVTAAFRDLTQQLKAKEHSSIKPFLFLQLLYMRFPQFAEKNEHGQPMQQDANEFLTELLRICQQKLQPSPVDIDGEVPVQRKNFIDQYFGIDFQNTMKCMDEDAAEEEATSSSETVFQLNCFISQDVKFLVTGIKSKLNEELTKNSPTLSRDAKYLKTSKIDRLPAYLCVQMVRFFFKEKGNVNAKILKDVKFPMSFDAYEFCTPALQERLKPMRDQFEAWEEELVEEKMAGKVKGGEKKKKNIPTPPDPNDPPKEYERFDFANDKGSNNSGQYELQSIITHQGRSSSSGHYVAWVRKSGDDWLKCDDDVVSPVTSEEVLKLSGGGDWHIAYLLLYGPRRLEVRPKKAPNGAGEASQVSIPMETESKNP